MLEAPVPTWLVAMNVTMKKGHEHELRGSTIDHMDEDGDVYFHPDTSPRRAETWLKAHADSWYHPGYSDKPIEVGL